MTQTTANELCGVWLHPSNFKTYRLWLFLALLMSTQPLFSQAKRTLRGVTVPLVGCRSDGQQGPAKAPRGGSKVVMISPKAAQRLAYYKADYGLGVLAPRGWHCFGTYGSSGDSLYVAPEPITWNSLYSNHGNGLKGFSGSAVQISMSYGGTSGRFTVAERIARVFPAHMSFTRQVIAEGIEPASDFPRGPFPKDKLTYRNNEIVEFQTPAYEDGLGTNSMLRKNGSPIGGVAILHGQDTDLVQLSIRLPEHIRKFSQLIIQQTEREAMRLQD